MSAEVPYQGLASGERKPKEDVAHGNQVPEMRFQRVSHGNVRSGIHVDAPVVAAVTDEMVDVDGAMVAVVVPVGWEVDGKVFEVNR